MKPLLKQFYYKNNRLQQLKGFYLVAQIGSVSRAAEKAGLNQSTITLQIQSLERDLNTKLFDRRSRKLILTNDGHLLYEMASQHLQAIDSLYEVFLVKKKEHRTCRIDIGIHHIASSYLLPAYVKEFSKLHPEAIIGIHNLSKEEALDELKKDKLDLIIYPNIDHAPELLVKTFRSFDPILIMRPDHPLAEKKQIELKEIAQYNTVRIDKELIALPLFEQTFKEFKFKTNIDFKNADWEMIKHYVKAGVGLGFISTICIDEDDKNLVYKKLNKYFPPMDYQIVLKKGKHQSHLVCDFINVIDSNLFPQSVLEARY